MIYTSGPMLCIYTFDESSNFGTHAFGLSDIGNLSSLARLWRLLSCNQPFAGRQIRPSEATSYSLFQTAMSLARASKFQADLKL